MIELNGEKVSGNVMKADRKLVDGLVAYAKERARLAELYSEHCDGDAQRFAGLKPLHGTLTATGETKDISPLLMGIFFEDINYAADGGLYGELIQNLSLIHISEPTRL